MSYFAVVSRRDLATKETTITTECIGLLLSGTRLRKKIILRELGSMSKLGSSNPSARVTVTITAEPHNGTPCQPREILYPGVVHTVFISRKTRTGTSICCAVDTAGQNRGSGGCTEAKGGHVQEFPSVADIAELHDQSDRPRKTPANAHKVPYRTLYCRTALRLLTTRRAKCREYRNISDIILINILRLLNLSAYMDGLVTRLNVARTVSRLRPVRPHTPFYFLAAHRVPTLWVLYRGLLRASPSAIVSRPDASYETIFCLTCYRCAHTYNCSSAVPVISPVPPSQRLCSREVIGCGLHPICTRICRLFYHEQWLHAFHKAKQGDEHLRSVMERFERLIDARRVNMRMQEMVNDSLVRSFVSFFLFSL
jgi:hypothetical protein